MFNEYDFIVNRVLYNIIHYYANLYKDIKYNMDL